VYLKDDRAVVASLNNLLYKMNNWHRIYFGGLANYENPSN